MEVAEPLLSVSVSNRTHVAWSVETKNLTCPVGVGNPVMPVTVAVSLTAFPSVMVVAFSRVTTVGAAGLTVSGSLVAVLLAAL